MSRLDPGSGQARGSARAGPPHSRTDLAEIGQVQLLHCVLAPVAQQRARHGDVIPQDLKRFT